MDIIIVCHTEAGFVDDKTKRLVFDKKSVSGATDGVFNLVKVAEKYNAKITFAVMPEVFDIFPKNIGHEIGLHIHPGWQEFSNKKFKWMVGDQYLKENCSLNKTSTLLTDYNYEEQLEIIEKGRDYFSKIFNSTPKVFLAGRWSENSDTTKVLEKLGFTHDCSVYPGLPSWGDVPRICMPYRAGDVLMVPVSRMIFKGAACLEDIRRFGLAWLKICFLEYYFRKMPLFHIALHSPAMTNDFYISAMDKLLAFISKQKNINFKFVSEI